MNTCIYFRASATTVAVALVISTALTGCGGTEEKNRRSTEPRSANSERSTSCSALVGGQDTSDFPATVLLATLTGGGGVSFCSSTFIGPNTIMTAGHCIDDTNPKGVRYLGSGLPDGQFGALYAASKAPSVVVTHGPGYVGSNMEINREDVRARDLAILIFPSDIAPAVSPLAAARVTPGSPVDVVGFGSTIFGKSDPRHKFRRQAGKNVVADVPGTENVAITTTISGVNPAAVLGSYGDSGGSLLHDGELAGVTSTISFVGQDLGATFFVDVSSEASQQLIEQAKALGASIGPLPRVAEPAPEPDSLPKADGSVPNDPDTQEGSASFPDGETEPGDPPLPARKTAPSPPESDTCDQDL